MSQETFVKLGKPPRDEQLEGLMRKLTEDLAEVCGDIVNRLQKNEAAAAQRIAEVETRLAFADNCIVGLVDRIEKLEARLPTPMPEQWAMEPPPGYGHSEEFQAGGIILTPEMKRRLAQEAAAAWQGDSPYEWR